jgi:hypothetical protein
MAGSFIALFLVPRRNNAILVPRLRWTMVMCLARFCVLWGRHGSTATDTLESAAACPTCRCTIHMQTSKTPVMIPKMGYSSRVLEHRCPGACALARASFSCSWMEFAILGTRLRIFSGCCFLGRAWIINGILHQLFICTSRTSCQSDERVASDRFPHQGC